ncbi:MAG TPA: D-2-hydroxyacid dehydrogenase [Candidatus Limnocylindria bacterium]|jgi:phosphoglycerate dehydrogenase-like enzyme|nr:D-2-hydroxyacid dehydrogenase [Candidatus Limnocylindria bacterium]
MSKLRIFLDLPVTPDLLEMLREGTQGHELLFADAPAASVLASPEPDPQIATADIAFGQPCVRAIEKAPLLKWVQVSSSGITRYDTPTFRALAAQRELPVTNSASVYYEACATHVLSFILAQARQLPLALRSNPDHKAPLWHSLRGGCPPLRGQSVLILGYGAIGQRLVEMLRPFDMNIVAYRRRTRGDETVPVIEENQLPQMLARGFDHLVNILPDSSETRHFFNAARFASLKPGAIFYNIGRGSTVDQAALLEALRSRRIAAAWLDVTDPEPLPNEHPLHAEPNCFITPHIAGGHVDESKTLVRHFLNNFRRFVQGQSLLDRVM